MDINPEEVKEKKRHDQKYSHSRPNSLLVEPRHWIKLDQISEHIHCYTYAVSCLGDVRGKTILDLGCGTGWFSVILAKRGAFVTGIDISPEAISIARKRAMINDVDDRISFKAKSFYELIQSFPKENFDKIIGLSVLHHCQQKTMLAEQLHWVLKPGGHVVFNEPFGNLRWMERLRLFIPVPVNEEDKTHWDEQITYADLNSMKSYFDIKYKEFQLFSRLDRIISNLKIVTLLGHLDRQLLKALPVLRPMARDIVISFEKRDR